MSAGPVAPKLDVEIVPVRDAETLALVRHLRYVVLVGEKKADPPGADHHRRLLGDGLDATGSTFAAFAGPTLVGSVRVNMLSDGGAEDYARAYGLDALGPDAPARTAVVTRLISRGGRGDAVLAKLVSAVLGVVAERRARFIAIGVEDQLIAFYTSMGFTRFKDDAISPAGGSRTVLLFDVEDPRHAQKATLAGWLYPSLFTRG
jgi:predicted GNAT family N-acyltransferase